MKGLGPRLAITIGVPLVVSLAAERLLLPGVPAELADVAGSHAGLGVFALGIAPVLTAYWIVEVVAFLVPRWSGLRHGKPEGRAKLERASRVLAAVLALAQGYGVAVSLQAMGGRDLFGSMPAPNVSVPLVVATLVGGVCVQFVAARLVTERGLVNGFVALWAASLVRDLGAAVSKALGWSKPARGGGLLDLLVEPRAHAPRALAIACLAVAVIAAATWVVLRGAGKATAADEARGAGGPYRDARGLVVRPWIPLPAGSFQSYLAATSLLMVPAVLANFHLPMGGVQRFIESAFLPCAIVLTLVIMAIFARLMNRPAELADLAVRLGATGKEEVARETANALRRALVPSAIFFVAILVASSASIVGAIGIVILVAVLVDFVHAARLGDLVPVWEERRAAAVPVLRAALSARGIEVETRGMAFLSLFQVFVPYAPAELLVAPADRERAILTLRHLLLGEAAPEAGERTSAPAERAWSFGRRAALLAACLGGAALALVALRLPERDDGPPVPPAKLEVVRVDDLQDPLADVPDSALPEGSGIEIFYENAPAGLGRDERVHYARIALREGESKRSAAARLRAFLDTVAVPKGARFAFAEVSELDPDTEKESVVGLRSYLLVGEPVLATRDVVDAAVAFDEMNDEARPYVAVTLSDDAATRFEEVTRAWIQRRIAILLDDEINSAPVVKSAIGGGRVSITMGTGDPQKQLDQAKRLAKGLRH